ncbi:MAG TPA: Gldg family protein, partial [Sphingobacterium sp.]|nr:Gldg family protein [Sphingobacterium sp.]
VAYYDTASTIRIDPNIPVEDQAMRRALSWGHDISKIWAPDSLRRQINLYPEQGMLVRMLSANGKSAPLRMFYDVTAYPDEREVIAALKRLLDKPLRVGMVEGQDERRLYNESDKDYGPFTTHRTNRGTWINLGAEFTTLRADSALLNIDSLDLLIIADPYRPYTAEQLANIHRYIAEGGNLLLTGEPNKQSILNPIVSPFGVRFNEGTILQESKEFELDLIQARFAKDLDETGFRIGQDTIITLFGATSLSYQDTAGFQIRPVLETDQRYVWNKLGQFDLKTEKIAFQSGVDNKVQLPVAVALTRQLGEREQRIFIAGDADIFSKGELGRYNVRNGNHDLTTQLLRWYSYDEYPPDTERPKPIDHRLRVNKTQVNGIRIATVFVVPILLALWGTLIIIRRKRK